VADPEKYNRGAEHTSGGSSRDQSSVADPGKKMTYGKLWTANFFHEVIL
jgi:hypothetical protein